MIRLVFAFWVVVNVLLAVWVNLAGSRQGLEYVPATAPRVGGDELILVEEVESSQLVFIEDVAEQKNAKDVVSPGLDGRSDTAIDSECFYLTDFSTKDAAESLADQVSALGVNVDLLVSTIEVPGPIMVYIKPFVSAIEAQRELRVLKSLNIDSFIISEGERMNGISLGVFRTEQNALAQEARIEALGYQVETSHILVQKDQFGLVASGDVLAALEEDYWLKIANENKEISIEQKVCNEVASEVNFQ